MGFTTLRRHPPIFNLHQCAVTRKDGISARHQGRESDFVYTTITTTLTRPPAGHICTSSLAFNVLQWGSLKEPFVQCDVFVSLLRRMTFSVLEQLEFANVYQPQCQQHHTTPLPVLPRLESVATRISSYRISTSSRSTGGQCLGTCPPSHPCRSTYTPASGSSSSTSLTHALTPSCCPTVGEVDIGWAPILFVLGFVVTLEMYGRGFCDVASYVGGAECEGR